MLAARDKYGRTPILIGKPEDIYESAEESGFNIRGANIIDPENFDDFLIAAFQTANETVYFSDGTHGLVQKIPLDPGKKLLRFEVEAVANEVIVNILALTLRK